MSEYKNIKNIQNSPISAKCQAPRSINEVLRSSKKDSSIKKKDRNRVKFLVRQFEDPDSLKSPQNKSKRKSKLGICTRNDFIPNQSKITKFFKNE